MSEARHPIDAENHYYEPRDFCTRHIDPVHWDKVIRVPGRVRCVGQGLLVRMPSIGGAENAA